MHRRSILLSTGLAAMAGTALGAVLAGPTRLLNWSAAVGSRRVAEGEAYGDHPRQRYDRYAPPTGAGRSPPPLVVFFYGGAWNRGRREDYRFVGEALAARGLMALVADYRLHPEVRYPDFVHDAAAVTAQALRRAADWGADAQRVVVAGHSAGAYLAAMLALDGRWLARAGSTRLALAGWAGLAGPYDFLPIGTPEVQRAFGHPAVPADSQPIVHAAASRLPCWLAAPREDARVDPQRNTEGLARALRAAGAPVALRRFDRVGHETLIGALAAPLRPLAPVLDELVAFVDALPPAARRWHAS